MSAAELARNNEISSAPIDDTPASPKADAPEQPPVVDAADVDLGEDPSASLDEKPVFPETDVALPPLPFDDVEADGEDHGGRTCPRTSEVDRGQLWKVRARESLSHDEELALVSRMKSGDAKAREELITAHHRLCAMLARRHRFNLGFVAAYDAAFLGLVSAIDTL